MYHVSEMRMMMLIIIIGYFCFIWPFIFTSG